MAFQRIRIKNTNVAGKIPGADKLDVAELCVNLKDQKLFSKDADGNVFKLGGKVESGPTPPTNGNETGDLFWDGDFLLVWNGTDWEPVAPVTSVNGEVGDVVLELGDLNDVAVDGVVDEQVLVYDANQSKWVPASAASLAVDVDLGYTAAADKGTVTNTAGDAAELPLADETNAGLMSPADYSKLAAMPGVISGPLAPNSPSPGDIWIDTGDCPPTINVWDDCDDPGNPTWKPIGGGGGGGCVQGPVQITSSNGTNLNSTLTAVGGNGVDEGASLTATYEWTGAKTGAGSSIIADVEGDYTVTASITCVDGSTLRSSAVWTVSDSYVDMVNNTAPVIAVVGEGLDGAYEGNSIYVVTNATVLNGEVPSVVETQWFKDDVADGTGSIYTIGAGDEGAVITAKQLFRDLRNNELLSQASNSITIVERPADAITFTAVITDDGTPNANKVGSVLTAAATNIFGGVAPVEYSFEWKSAGATVGATKTYTLQSSDVGKIIQCDVTVAEPDGSNPETRTATYSKAIEVAGTINKPTVLAPSDGAGSGVTRDIVTDAITAVAGGGVDVCETELIESVDSYPLSHTGTPVNDVTGPFVAPFPSVGETVDFSKGGFTRSDDLSLKFDNITFTDKVEVIGAATYGSSGDTSTKYCGFNGGGEQTFEFTPQYSTDALYERKTIATATPESPRTLTSIEVYGTAGGNFLLGAVYVDGVRLENGNITLTFPSAQGFDCFAVGDVVQPDPDLDQRQEWSTKVTTSSSFDNPPANAFDLDTTNVCSNTYTAPGQSRIDIAFNPPIDVKQKVEIVGGNGSGDRGYAVIDGVNQPAIDLNTNNTGTLNYQTLFTGSGELTAIGVYDTVENSTQNQCGFSSIRIDGKRLVDKSIQAPSSFRIVSIPDPQTDPPTIVVDGGDWTGSDGTSSGDAADRKDKLTKSTPYDTKLTLAGAKDLDDLNVGDVVKMGDAADVPYQPVSDSIVSVKDRVKGTSLISAVLSNTPAAIFDGNLTTFWSDRTSGQGLSFTNLPTSQSKIRLNIGALKNQAAGWLLTANNNIPLSINFTNIPADGWVDISADLTFPFDLTRLVITGGNRDSTSFGLSAIEIDDVIVREILITLSGDTDLAYFRVGDVVQSKSLDLGDQQFYDVSISDVSKWHNSGTTPDKMWDSNYQTACIPAQNASFTGDFRSVGGIPIFQNLYIRKSSAFTMVNLAINGITIKSTYAARAVTDPSGNNYDAWVIPANDINGKINTIYLSRQTGPNGDECYALWDDNGWITGDDLGTFSIISIDDTVPSITVDGGEWDASNQSQVWSDLTNWVVSNIDSGSVANMFNGNLTEGLVFASNGSAQWNIPTSYAIKGSLEVRAYVGNNDDSLPQFFYNGVWNTPIEPNAGAGVADYTWETGTSVVTGFKFAGSSGASPAVYNIYQNGRLLVDQGIRDFGDNKVTCVSPLKAPTDWKVEVIDTDNNQLSLSHSTPNDNAQVWVANDNQAGTDFFVTGPNIVDEPLLTADVRLESSLFATTPADADTLKNIVWELNGAEQSAGTSNPYAPTGLAINTTYTVRVKHQGNALEDSPWSDSTTFTTGATRNLYTYYKERVEVLENRLAGLEADEVVDDATDVTLLTVVANLIERVETLEGGA